MTSPKQTDSPKQDPQEGVELKTECIAENTRGSLSAIDTPMGTSFTSSSASSSQLLSADVAQKKPSIIGHKRSRDSDKLSWIYKNSLNTLHQHLIGLINLYIEHDEDSKASLLIDESLKEKDKLFQMQLYYSKSKLMLNARTPSHEAIIKTCTVPFLEIFKKLSIEELLAGGIKLFLEQVKLGRDYPSGTRRDGYIKFFLLIKDYFYKCFDVLEPALWGSLHSLYLDYLIAILSSCCDAICDAIKDYQGLDEKFQSEEDFLKIVVYYNRIKKRSKITLNKYGSLLESNYLDLLDKCGLVARDKFDLILMTISAKSEVESEIKNFPQRYQGPPVLIKQNTKLFIYGNTDGGNWRITQLDGKPFELLSFPRENEVPKILHIDSTASPEVYTEIAEKKGHIFDNSGLLELPTLKLVFQQFNDIDDILNGDTSKFVPLTPEYPFKDACEQIENLLTNDFDEKRLTDSEFFSLELKRMGLNIPFVEMLSVSLPVLDKDKMIKSFELVERCASKFLPLINNFKLHIDELAKEISKTCINNLVPFASYLLNYSKFLNSNECFSYAFLALRLARMLLQPLEFIKGIPTKIQQDIDRLNKQIDEDLKKVTEAEVEEQKAKADPLYLAYGKDKKDASTKPFFIPFPYHLLEVNRLSALRRLHGITDTDKQNLSIHCLTIVYSEERIGLLKSQKKIIHLRLSPPAEIFTYEGLGKEQTNPKYLARTQRGYDDHKSFIKYNHTAFSLGSVTRPISFSAREHRHSEQLFFEWLSTQNLSKLFDNIQKQEPAFKPGCKVYMIAIDMRSWWGSCVNCRLAALSTQSPSIEGNDFLVKFQAELTKQGYRIPKDKGNGIQLKGVTRILAEHGYSGPQHTNPETRNVKYLDNTGVFQAIQPSAFGSGHDRSKALTSSSSSSSSSSFPPSLRPADASFLATQRETTLTSSSSSSASSQSRAVSSQAALPPASTSSSHLQMASQSSSVSQPRISRAAVAESFTGADKTNRAVTKKPRTEEKDEAIPAATLSTSSSSFFASSSGKVNALRQAVVATASDQKSQESVVTITASEEKQQHASKKKNQTDAGKYLSAEQKQRLLQHLKGNPTLNGRIKFGTVESKGDCFFESFAQALKDLDPKQSHTIKSLRMVCHNYAQGLQKKDPEDNWIKMMLNPKKDKENKEYKEYLARIRETAEEAPEEKPLFGDGLIDGRILCEKFNCNLHVIDFDDISALEPQHRKITKENSGNSVSAREALELYSDQRYIHLIRVKGHYFPLLPN